MCNATGIAFSERMLTREIVAGREVLEVGAFDVNGSVRPHAESLGPKSYLGVDITQGPRVDRVVNARQLVHTFGGQSFDVVITTEMVEHVRDWRTVVSNLKTVLRPGGYLLVTTRSAGFPYHGWPHDFWRYEQDDMRRIFGDLEILTIESDPASPGVFVFARRPEQYVEATPDLALYSIVTGRRERRVTNVQIAWYRVSSALRPKVDDVVRRIGASWRALRRVRWKAGFRRRLVGPFWRVLPDRLRSTIKRALGRADVAH